MKRCKREAPRKRVRREGEVGLRRVRSWLMVEGSGGGREDASTGTECLPTTGCCMHT